MEAPEGSGGQDAGPTPFDMLLSGLSDPPPSTADGLPAREAVLNDESRR